MKKIILIFVLLFPFRGLGGLTFAQKDSVKVLFSEETVESFEQTEVIGIAERMGVKRPVKAAVRGGINVVPNVTPNSSSDLFIGYEQKLNKELSLNLTLLFHSQSLKFGIEPRWYFDMKKRVNQGLQAYNTSGRYVSFRFTKGTLKTDNSLMFFYTPYYESTACAINYGHQFGNVLDLSISAGYKNVRESYVDNGGLIKNNLILPQSTLWFISTNFRLGVGLNFPRFKSQKDKKFEKLTFSNNNFDVNHLLKIDLQNLLHIDKYNQHLKVEMDYEHRIGNSFFSSNTSFSVEISAFKFYSQNGIIDSTLKFKYGDFKIKIPIWENEQKSNFYSNVRLSQQVRYYMFKNREIRRGKSGKNFNGIYTGLEASYLYSAFNNNTFNNKYFSNKSDNGSFFGAGAVFGFQNQFNNKVYFDWSYSALLTKNNPTSSIVFSKFGNLFINSSLKIGFVR